MTVFTQRRREIGDRMNARAEQLYADLGLNPNHAEYRDWGNINRTVRGEPLLPLREVECGTIQGYERHMRYRETVCDSCRQANHRHTEDRRTTAA